MNLRIDPKQHVGPLKIDITNVEWLAINGHVATCFVCVRRWHESNGDVYDNRANCRALVELIERMLPT